MIASSVGRRRLHLDVGSLGHAAVWLGAVALIIVSVRWGRTLEREDPFIHLGAAPLVGRDPKDGWDWRFSPSLVAAGVLGSSVALATWHGWWWRLRTRLTVPIVGIGSATFAVLLALTDGRDGLLYGATHPTEYQWNVDRMPGLRAFLASFVADIDRYSVHVRGHPPGFVAFLAVLDGIGLGGGWPVAALSIAGVAATSTGVLVAVWAVGGVEWVRRCAPFQIVAPYAIWMITSADATFSAVGAWGVATGLLGLRSNGRRSVAWGAVSGLLLGGLLFLTYGGVTFLLVPVVPALLTARRRPMSTAAVIAAAAAAAAVVTAAFAAAGFWWFDGAAETRRQYWAGTASIRPGAYFAVANIAAAIIAVGPATVAGLRRCWTDRSQPAPVRPLVVGALLAVAASHVSQYTRAEVERIWLLFYPWLAVSSGFIAISGVADRSRDRRRAMAIAGQAIVAIVVQSALVSKW